MNTPNLLLGAALAGMLSCTVAVAQNRELGSRGTLIEGIAAVVEEGVVLKSELAMRTQIVVDGFRQQQAQLPEAQRGQLPPMSVLEAQVLDQLVLKEIQLQRAARLGIVVGDDVLNQALAEIAQRLNITLEQMPAALAAEGLDYNLYRQDSREDIILSQLEQRDVYSRIRVTPRELEQCLVKLEATQTDEFDYNVSHILIGVSGSASSDELAAAEARANAVQEQLAAGAEFAELALTYSDGPTALEGGSLGWRKGSQLPTIFADVVPSLKSGEVSSTIKTASGFHIVKLNEMRGAERVVVDQVHARHILISPNEILDDDATHQKMLGIYDQIQGGADFATLATSTSEDTGSAADGGDLGWTTADIFVPEFSEQLNSLPVGTVSEPFRTRFGWHIVEVLERRAYDTTEEVKEQRCQQEIRAGKVEEERQLWLQQLRDQAYVDIRL
jgi:peptidyl-prolyl cis-trans isomerase SurA